MTTALDELENVVNDAINRMRRATEAKESGADTSLDNHPKVAQLHKSLSVALEHFNSVMGRHEPALGEQAPQTMLTTPADILSSPYAGEEPRYVAQHDGNPEPIEKVQPTPPAQSAGRVDPEDPPKDSKSAPVASAAPAASAPAPAAKSEPAKQ